MAPTAVSTNAGRNNRLPLLLHLGRPAFDAFTFAANHDVQLHVFHSLGVGQESMVAHAPRIRPLVRNQVEHGKQEVAHFPTIFDIEMVLLSEDVRKCPVPQTVDVAKLSFPIEDLLRPFARETQRLWEGT